jgi:V/A-type H+-transporting ATPase subunit E
MVEEIRDLIEKINEDGIRAAEEKARIIEAAATQRADEIRDQARREAEEMVAAARERIRREEGSEKTLLTQAGRDLLLSLRNEINAMLDRIMVSEIRNALTPAALSTLLSEVVHRYGAGEPGDISVALNGKDLEALERSFLHRLREETKKNIVLRPAEGISGGFVISFDSGSSCYDFTDRALAEYIGAYLKPKLNRILQEAIGE